MLPCRSTAPPPPPGGDDLPFVYSSTLIVQGHGIARVLSTGINTEVGKIGKSLQQIDPGETMLQKETGELVKKFAIAGALLCLLVIAIFGIVRSDWLGGFLAGLALVLYVPFLQELFRFTSLSAGEVAMCFAAGALSIVAFEMVKWSKLWKHQELEGAQDIA